MPCTIDDTACRAETVPTPTSRVWTFSNSTPAKDNTTTCDTTRDETPRSSVTIDFARSQAAHHHHSRGYSAQTSIYCHSYRLPTTSSNAMPRTRKERINGHHLLALYTSPVIAVYGGYSILSSRGNSPKRHTYLLMARHEVRSGHGRTTDVNHPKNLPGTTGVTVIASVLQRHSVFGKGCPSRPPPP